MKVEQIALMDMDGSLCDYELHLLEDLKSIAGPNDPVVDNLDLHNAPDWLSRRIDLIRSVPGWWLKLSRIERGFDVLEMCNQIGFNIKILTKGPKPGTIRARLAWAEKIEWCYNHLAPIPFQMTITEDKGGSYGKVLFDDYPAYMDRWLEHRPRGLGIMLTHKWNEDYNHPNVIKYTGENKEEVFDALTKCYNRQPREN